MKTTILRSSRYRELYRYTVRALFLSSTQLILAIKHAVGAEAVRWWHVRGGGGGAKGPSGGGGAGKGGGGVGAPTYARNPPRDGVLYEELEVHWGASSRCVRAALLLGGQDPRVYRCVFCHAVNFTGSVASQVVFFLFV